MRRSRGLGACGAGSSRPHALYSVSDSEGLSGRLGLREREKERARERERGRERGREALEAVMVQGQELRHLN